MLGLLRVVHLACFLEYRVLPDARTMLAFCAHLAFMLAFFGDPTKWGFLARNAASRGFAALQTLWFQSHALGFRALTQRVLGLMLRRLESLSTHTGALQHLGGSDEVSRIRGVDRARAVDRRVRWRLRAITPIKQLERGQGQAVTYTTSKAPMSVCPGVDCTGA